LESEFRFLRSNFFAGLVAGHFARLTPASFSPAKCPAKKTEPGKGFLRWTCLKVLLRSALGTHGDTLLHSATLCYTLLQSTTRCKTLPHPATPCHTLPHPATPCYTRNALQHTATHSNTMHHTCLKVLLRSAIVMRARFHLYVLVRHYCNALQRTATHCNTLQHAATESIHTGSRSIR